MGGKKTTLDLEELAKEIPTINPDKKLYWVLKRGLSSIGYWKNRPRGNPKKAWSMRGKKGEGKGDAI